MRRTVAIAALFTALSLPLTAQTFGGPGISPFAKDYRVDMAIPEAPAFKLLAVENSNILRPGLPADLNTVLAHFFDEDGLIRVPESLGIELSPALLISGPRLSRATYQQQKFLYAFRFSAATATQDEGGRDVAFGMRFGIVNDADLRLDDAFVNDTSLQITSLLTRINQIHSAALERQGPPPQRVGPPTYTPAEREEIDELSGIIRDRWAERYWNARAFDFAIGLRATSFDDLGFDTRITAFGAWASYSHGFGDWGQLLIGGRAAGERPFFNNNYDQVFGLGLRMYVGTNTLKGFIEVQDEWRDEEDAELFFNSGAEVRFMDWIWGSASLGFTRAPDGATNTKTSLQFHTTFPRL